MRELLRRDFERFKTGLPAGIAAYIREAYQIDLTARYLGERIPHPIGKASGQLSLNPEQLAADAAAGLAFVVLKTVIGQDERGGQAMRAWAIHESRMRVEPLRGSSGRDGWTVTWKGRGWDRSFEEYLALVRAGRAVAREHGMLVVPSAKYHLPELGEAFREPEYRYTTRSLAEAWGAGPLLMEKDFSPTLAGDPLASERERVLRWVREVPGQIRRHAPHGARIALKLMNARFDDGFQLDMLRAAREADTLVVFNRLFDPTRGVAYGGWDLSDRNLRVLEQRPATPPLSGTGNVCSGRMVLAYAERGCETVQVHTYFQLPLSKYPATAGSRSARALHALLFHPDEGLIAAMLEREAQGRLSRHAGTLRFLDLVGAPPPEPA